MLLYMRTEVGRVLRRRRQLVRIIVIIIHSRWVAKMNKSVTTLCVACYIRYRAQIVLIAGCTRATVEAGCLY